MNEYTSLFIHIHHKCGSRILSRGVFNEQICILPHSIDGGGGWEDIAGEREDMSIMRVVYLHPPCGQTD